MIGINDLGIQELGDCVKAAFESVCADVPDSEQLAQKVREKFEEGLREWKEELQDSEDGESENQEA